MDALTVTHHSDVTEDQIDHLGHMNVRFYGINARRGSDVLLGEFGLAPEQFSMVDGYTRHHREQLLGARLLVRSGVLDVDRDGLLLYHELANAETDQIAATFVQRLRAEGEVGGLAGVSEAPRASIPDHGQPRSITLDSDPIASAPTLGVLAERGLAMRHPRPVSAEECDERGVLRPSEVPSLTWGGVPIAPEKHAMLHEGPNGERMGWASMETRMVIGRLPGVGDRIQSFGAEIDLRDKTSHRIQWAYDLDRGQLLATFEIINLAFDTNQRRAMSIPDAIRADHERHLHRDLAPT